MIPVALMEKALLRNRETQCFSPTLTLPEVIINNPNPLLALTRNGVVSVKVVFDATLRLCSGLPTGVTYNRAL